ncbi:GNAT family N-acetyltransferase [Actinomadura sp. CNU-125]|uniref:GNAT family N-acetyltransferase n=1 Tax=Actinomadura sp. CNU-125 TaxID=1904961 RepID=UPI00095A3454|nr:GNAT family N-acetyltransferase [Actinomadura sp. CNU-125]OLT22704.1 GNAT family N-acetyltransferase [Actinomadura sp. CNU-125]
MDFEVRVARDADLAVLPEIERAADGLFRPFGIVFPPGPTVIEELIGTDAGILVAGDPPVAFAAVRDVDGAAHLEQIAVRADLTGRGIGVPLLAAVRTRAAGSPGVSLLTFRDVPWNMPWYERHGFAELPEARWGPGLRAHWDAEVAAGLHRLGPRVVMWAPTDRPGACGAAAGTPSPG